MSKMFLLAFTLVSIVVVPKQATAQSCTFIIDFQLKDMNSAGGSSISKVIGQQAVQDCGQPFVVTVAASELPVPDSATAVWHFEAVVISNGAELARTHSEASTSNLGPRDYVVRGYKFSACPIHSSSSGSCTIKISKYTPPVAPPAPHTATTSSQPSGIENGGLCSINRVGEKRILANYRNATSTIVVHHKVSGTHSNNERDETFTLGPNQKQELGCTQTGTEMGDTFHEWRIVSTR